VIGNNQKKIISIICVINEDSTQFFNIQSEVERFRLKVPDKGIITLTLSS
jgi:hypothetical protein